MSLLELLDCAFFLGTYLDIRILLIEIMLRKQALLKAMAL